MKLFIKNMVCDRCVMAVRSELDALGLHPEHIELGVAHLPGEVLPEEQYGALEARLGAIGFELLDDAKHKLAEQIKVAVIGLIHRAAGNSHVKHSEYLAQQTGKDYPYLSKIFSAEEGLTIEQYIIRQKTERIKELLTYGELSLGEIAWQMGYSSVAAISAQFKKVTGLTPSQYKATDDKARKTLDAVGK